MTASAVPAETGLTELAAEEARATDGGGLWEWLFGSSAGGGSSGAG